MHILVLGSAPTRPGNPAGSGPETASGAGSRAWITHLDLGDRPGPRLAGVVGALTATGNSCLVVCGSESSVAARRAISFARQAIRSRHVSLLGVDTSPLRMAVVAETVADLMTEVGLPDELVPSAFSHIVRCSRSVLVARSVARMRRPRPTVWQRLSRRPPGAAYTATDQVADEPVLAVPRGEAVPEALLPRAWDGGATVTVARGRLPIDVPPLLSRIGDHDVREVAHQDKWSAWWGTGVATEIVVRPRDLPALGTEILAGSSASWPCSWCGHRLSSLSACPACNAQFQA